MPDRVKVTITPEDGGQPTTIFLTDDTPFLVIKKTGGTVESVMDYAGTEVYRDLVRYLRATLSPEDRDFVFTAD